MVNIMNYAQIVRSKNSGPFNLTFDILFISEDAYNKAKGSGSITKENIARLYKIPVENVLVFLWFDAALALKATIVRPVGSGALHETDVYGAQQHAPLLSLEIDEEETA